MQLNCRVPKRVVIGAVAPPGVAGTEVFSTSPVDSTIVNGTLLHSALGR
jgi:hypothetical protein